MPTSAYRRCVRAAPERLDRSHRTFWRKGTRLLAENSPGAARPWPSLSAQPKAARCRVCPGPADLPDREFPGCARRPVAQPEAQQGAVLHGSVGERTEPTPSLCLSDADGLRASKLKHAVQGLNCDGDLRRATLVRPRTQGISDHSFKPADGGLHQGTTRVPGSSSASPCVHARRCFGDAGRAGSERSPHPRSAPPSIVVER